MMVQFIRTYLAPLRWPAFALLLAITLWIGTKAGGDGQMHNDYIAPYGFVSLELAGAERAPKILATWDMWGGREVARKSIYVDFVFLIFYSTTMALACLMAAGMFCSLNRNCNENDHQPLREGTERSFGLLMAKLGLTIALIQWQAALLDAVENYGLLRILDDRDSRFWADIVWWLAASKFTLIALGLAYISLALITYSVVSIFRPVLQSSAE